MSVFELLNPFKLLLQRNRAMLDRDAVRLTLSQAIAERDSATEWLARAQAERDSAAAWLARAQEERDRAMAERDCAIAARDAALAESMSLAAIRAQLTQVQQVANLIARRHVPRRKQIRVLFVAHFAHAWRSLDGVYRAMLEDDEFDPVVVTIDHRFDDRADFAGEAGLHEELERLGIPHLRWGALDGEAERKLVTALAPDVVFLQTHWDGSFPEPLRALSVGFARTCYVHYGQKITEGGWNDEYSLSCWRVFCESELVRSLYAKHAKMGALNAVVTGNPKLDHLHALRDEPGVWPVTSSRRKFRLLWSVHHSFGEDGYGFGTFVENHRAMLNWARRTPEIEFVLTFHHLFFDKVRAADGITPEEVDAFMAAWRALPNTGIYGDSDIGQVFAASDAHITDTVSFLVEYQVMDKPLISFESRNPYPFNEAGERIMKGVYRARTVADASAIVDRFRREGLDPLREERRAVVREVMPFPEGAALRIVNEIRQALRIEGRDGAARMRLTQGETPRVAALAGPPSRRRT